MDPLVKLINASFSSGIFPSALKTAKITPIFKGGDNTFPTNYRPISSLPFLSKIIERALYDRIMNFADEYSLFTDLQFGFRKGISTVDSLIHLTESVYNSLDLKKHHLSVLLDLKKAFDTVQHGILLDKLEYYGIRSKALLLIKSYLSNRPQYIQVNNNVSTQQILNSSVPQGSIVGPLFFLFFINDLVSMSTNCEIQLFADDAIVSSSNSNYDLLSEDVNSDLQIVSGWMLSNRLTLNTDKCNYIIFSNRNYRTNDILVNSSLISNVLECKYLGVYLDRNLNFEYHIINYILNKTSKLCGILYKLRNLFPTETCIRFYYALIYPYLSYCILIWGNTYQSHLNPLFKLQKRVVRTIAKVSRTEHTTPLFLRFNLLKLEDIYKYSIAVYMFKNRNYFSSNGHLHNTRNRNQLVPVYHRLTQTQKAISFMGPKIWNQIPIETREIESLKLFKKCVKNLYLENNLLN